MKKRKLLIVTTVMCCVLLVAAGCGEKKEPLPPMESAAIGTMEGSVNEGLASSKYPEAKVKKYANYTEASDAVLSGEIDYAMMDYATAMNFARHNEKLAVMPEKLTDEVTAMALNPKFPERNMEIKDIVSRYLSDGTMNEIISHWMKEDGGEYEILPSVAPSKGETLRIAVTTATEPRCFLVDGKPTGMVIELMDRICAELGMVPEYQDMAFGEMMTSLAGDKSDVVPAMYKTPEREKIADFAAGYFPNPQVLLVLSDRINE